MLSSEFGSRHQLYDCQEVILGTNLSVTSTIKSVRGVNVWNRAKTVLATMILITACLTVCLPIYLKTYALAPTPGEAEKAFGFPVWAYRPIDGQEVSLDQAQALVPFRINLPACLGTPALIKVLLPPQTDTPSVTIVYATVKLSSDASPFDVLNQNGIGLWEMPNKMTLEKASENIKAAIDGTKNAPGGGLRPVTINGYPGYEGGNVGHEVTWYTETTVYVVEANVNYPLQQLEAIAQSIPVS
jgi:hypothetical protein